MKLQKKVNKSNFYIDFVNILNGVLQLSGREAEVFSHILEFSDNGFKDNINHKTIRTLIVKDMGISEANLSRYLNTLKVKGLIVKGDNNKWIINDNIIPVFINDSVEINFTLNIQEDDTIETRKIHGEYSQEKQK